MTGHRRKAGIDLPGLARSYPVNCGPHVIEDPALRHAAQNPERLGQGVKQHLVGLQRIGAHDERLAVRQLGVRRLQLGLLARNNRPVLAPVELESLAGSKNQRHERAATTGLLLALALGLPGPHKGCNALIGTVIAQHDKVGMHLLGCTLALARLACLNPQPA